MTLYILVSKFSFVFTFKTFCNQSVPYLRLNTFGWLKNEVYKVEVNIRGALIRRISNTAAKKTTDISDIFDYVMKLYGSLVFSPNKLITNIYYP
jgi:hypothetical protein